MNGAITQAAVDTAVNPAQRQAKSKTPGNGEFKNMLSDAIGSGSNTSGNDVKPVKTAKTEESAAAKTEPKLPKEPKTSKEPGAVRDGDDEPAYAQQAAVAIQMQVIAPIAAEIQPAEIPEETAPAAIDAVEVQATYTQTGIQATTSEPVSATVQSDSPATETNDSTAAQPQAATAVSTPISFEAAARQAMEQTAGTPQQEQATRAQQPLPAQEPNPEAYVIPSGDSGAQAYNAAASGAAEEQAIRQPQPTVRMHSLHGPQKAGEAQAKFDEMLAKASQELTQSPAVQETAEIPTEIPDETSSMEQPFILEANPQATEPVEPEIPEAEAAQRQEVKPEVRETPQKSVEVSAKEQRPQKETSKAGETALGMVQQKQPEILHETIRSEPAPGQPHQVQQPDQAEQIKAQVIKNLETERTEFEMQLHPEELGKVNVKMILEGGKLSVEIAAANPKSAEMLSKQAESLAASLKASGADVSSVNVVTANENASAQMNSEYNMNNFQRQFQNRENGREQGGRPNGTGNRAHRQAASSVQAVGERPQSPQRILNYSV